MPQYSKPYLSLPDQLNLLKSRGLQVADDAAAIECLHRNGYYRLSAYWHPFREIIRGVRTDNFLTGSHFEDAVNLYRFDKKFKLLLLDAIERVEIAARVEISLHLGQRFAFAHEKRDIFRQDFAYSEWVRWIGKTHQQTDQSKAPFVEHHRNVYGKLEYLPIWIAIELWDFGMLSYAFSGMQYHDQVAVAGRFTIPDWQLMRSWLRSLNYVRNVIAHHGRLWNLGLSRPQLPPQGMIPDMDSLLLLPMAHTRIYTICCILCYFTRIINPQSFWINEMKTLVNDFPSMPHANIHNMGFPADWQSQSLWQ